MKKLMTVIALMAVVALVVAVSFAQPKPDEDEAPPPRNRRGGLFLRVFDANKDGQISEQEWASVFKKMDKDGDGVLSKEELEESRGMVRQEAEKRIFQRFDADDSGTISKDEFPGRDERFDKIDANADGELSPEELQEATAKRHEMMKQRGERGRGTHFRRGNWKKDPNAAE